MKENLLFFVLVLIVAFLFGFLGYAFQDLGTGLAVFLVLLISGTALSFIKI